VLINLHLIHGDHVSSCILNLTIKETSSTIAMKMNPSTSISNLSISPKELNIKSGIKLLSEDFPLSIVDLKKT
jgi:hypothetical protein